jgi:hypothetical protein
MMKNRFIALGLAAGLLMTSGAVSIQAQGPGGWGGPRGGGPGGGPRGGAPVVGAVLVALVPAWKCATAPKPV